MIKLTNTNSQEFYMKYKIIIFKSNEKEKDMLYHYN